jgi:hypothetical protein
MIPCLDKGYVELLSCAPDGKALATVVHQMRRGYVGPHLLRIPTVYLKFKAPYFVTLAMGNIRSVTDQSYQPEVYHPEVDEVGSIDVESRQDIVESIRSTIDAGNLNREMYVKDGCNRFTATMTSTVSTYWQGLMYADLETWCDFYQQKHAPHQIKVYQKAVEDILKVEYPELDDYLRRSK